jgi:hypothetical protein
LYIFRFSSVQFFSDEKWVVTNKITFKISNQGSVFVDISVQFSSVHFRRKMGSNSNKQNYVQNKQSGVCFRIYFSYISYFRWSSLYFMKAHFYIGLRVTGLLVTGLQVFLFRVFSREFRKCRIIRECRIVSFR